MCILYSCGPKGVNSIRSTLSARSLYNAAIEIGFRVVFINDEGTRGLYAQLVHDQRKISIFIHEVTVEDVN